MEVLTRPSFEDTRVYFLCCIPSFSVCVLAFHLIGKRHPHLSLDQKDNIVAFWHAVMATILSGYSLFMLDPPLFTSIHAASTQYHQIMFALSLGYFVFDFGRNLFYQSEDASMMCHHVLVITVYFMTIYKGMFGYELCAILFGTEISNPCLHIRRFLRSVNEHTTWYARVNDIIFIGLFSIMRIGVGSWMTYKIMVTPHPDTVWMFRVTMAMLYILSWYWFLMMMRMARREIGRMMAPTTNGVAHVNGHSVSAKER